MKYMLLIHTSDERWQTLSQADKEEFLAEYAAFTEEIESTGEHCHGSPLTHRRNAVSVRVRDGRAAVERGPLTDDDRYLAGYFVVDCADEARALEIAARVPDAKLNVVEVRALAVV